MKINFLVGICFLFTAMLASVSHAAEVEKTVAQLEWEIGYVDFIDHQNKVVVIDDGSFVMALNFKLKDRRGKNVNRYALKPGQQLQYKARYGRKMPLIVIGQIK